MFDVLCYAKDVWGVVDWSYELFEGLRKVLLNYNPKTVSSVASDNDLRSQTKEKDIIVKVDIQTGGTRIVAGRDVNTGGDIVGSDVVNNTSSKT
jgi:hypothetical protein